MIFRLLIRWVCVFDNNKKNKRRKTLYVYILTKSIAENENGHVQLCMISSTICQFKQIVALNYLIDTLSRVLHVIP